MLSPDQFSLLVPDIVQLVLACPVKRSLRTTRCLFFRKPLGGPPGDPQESEEIGSKPATWAGEETDVAFGDGAVSLL